MKKNMKETVAIETVENKANESKETTSYGAIKGAESKASYIEGAFQNFAFCEGLEFRRYAMSDVLAGRDRLNRGDYVANMFACTEARFSNEKASVCLKARKTPYETSNRFSVLEVKAGRGSDITLFCNESVATLIKASGIKVENERKYDLKCVLTVNYSQLANVMTAVNDAYSKAVKAC